MRRISLPLPRVRAKLARFFREFRHDSEGTTVIEFALVSIPFVVMILAMMTVGIHFLTSHSLQRGVLDAARQLRTGEAQKAGLDLDDFRELVCNAAGSFISCDKHLVIHIKSNAKFAGLAPATSCLTNGKLTPSAGNGTDAVSSRSGEESTAVQVTACYEWEMGSVFWQTIWDLISPTPILQGKTVLSATTAFRSEPYR
ncbi:pilus assembly protein [Hyphomicrobium sp. LHD-15]|uniref:TadE/TadG family type IV pilus assembly protein n=1 Tax=Hyphomicrobium sp. LHD-15 TaxID=3072142 RepID=UPI00280FD9D2|nr:pilus assembly protein [Hyphomicrobium sp. LHD-15]MDQ8700250.1 pilus assembly protein [Hyphomicrobium sp. LHD-15]